MSDNNIMTRDDEQKKNLNGFLKNEDHIEFVGNILGDVFESEEEALAALSRIMVNGKRLTNIDDHEEAVRIIKEAILKNGIEDVKIEVNGSFQPLSYSLGDDEDILDIFRTDKKKKKDRPLFGESKKAEKDEKTEKEADIPEKENILDMTEDIYTFIRPESFDLNSDTFSENFLDANVSGIVVLSRLSGILLDEHSGKDLMDQAANRLFVNGLPLTEFCGMKRDTPLTEEDYNTLGKNAANILKETFVDGNGKNFLMFKTERDRSFEPFTMAEKPMEVKLLSGIKRAFASKEEIEKNRAEYNDYIENVLPHYEVMKKISAEAKEAAASLKPPMPEGKVRKTGISELEKKNFGFSFERPTLTAPVMQKAETSLENEKEPQFRTLSPKRGRHSDEN